jgi:hypothetical protein
MYESTVHKMSRASKSVVDNRYGPVLWVALALLLQCAALVTALSGPPDWKVYLRSILFSSLYDDLELTDERALDSALAQDFKRDGNADDYLPYLDARAARTLKDYQATTRPTDRDLALTIVTQLGDPRESQICGIESLNRVVFDTSRGQGCCSDFSKAWIFYALYLGMRVREVSTLNHTTVEYFDRQSGRWAWLDPFNRLEIVDETGRPLNQYELRSQTLFERSNFRRLPGGHEDFQPQAYAGYATAQMAVISWRRGANFLQVEAWDKRLRALYLPKSARQMVLLTTGNQPGWLVLTTSALTAYLKALQVLAWSIVAVLLATNVVLVVLAVRGGWRAWQVGRGNEMRSLQG